MSESPKGMILTGGGSSALDTAVMAHEANDMASQAVIFTRGMIEERRQRLNREINPECGGGIVGGLENRFI